MSWHSQGCSDDERSNSMCFARKKQLQYTVSVTPAWCTTAVQHQLLMFRHAEVSISLRIGVHPHRQLLQVLRDLSQPSTSQQHHKGASEVELRQLVAHVCEPSSPLIGDACSICLCSFEAGHSMKCMQCLHHFHAACLDEWLRVRAACPLCQMELDVTQNVPSGG